MSGFVAVFNKDGSPVDRELLHTLTQTMTFRGPDGLETWSDGCIGLGHTQFITDPDGPIVAQPCSLDGRTWLTGDVRVDGRDELIARLSGKVSVSFADESDAELILHAYRMWGEGCLEYLIGDFALAIWDAEQRKLFFARDQMGIKPLFYAETAHTVVVSNTIGALRRHPAVSDELDALSIGDYLVFDELMDLTRTGFAQIRRLRAAHCATVSPRDLRIRPYWSLPIDEPVYVKNYDYYVDGVLSHLRLAVRDRFRADDIAIRMSGGLDSSAVAALAREWRPLGAIDAHTHIWRELIEHNEERYASAVAKHLAIGITYRVCDEDELYPAGARNESPRHAPLNHPTLKAEVEQLRDICASHRTLLTGYGGDPGLHPWPTGTLRSVRKLGFTAITKWIARTSLLHGRLPAFGLRTALRRRFQKPDPAPEIPDYLLRDFSQEWDLAARFELRRSQVSAVVHPRQSGYDDLSSEFWSSVAEQFDPGASGVALDVRHPFLDTRLIRFLLRIPSFPYTGGKRVLRDAMAPLLPPDVVERPKEALLTCPVTAALARNRDILARDFQAAPVLDGYVDTSRLLHRSGDAVSSTTVWGKLRPYGLNCWLSAVAADQMTCPTTTRQSDVGSSSQPSSVSGVEMHNRSNDSQRKVYVQPRLTVVGSVRLVTRAAANTMTSMADGGTGSMDKTS